MQNVNAEHYPMIERLLAAGCVLHARITTPELRLSGMCHSKAWG
jgi:Asp-tRNA(Asn)/Glu-tRNA(Gln) amidotransferase A subunit family amidase